MDDHARSQRRKSIMKIRRFLSVLCLLMALPLGMALAGGPFTVDVDGLDLSRLNHNDYVAAHLTSDAAGICVCKSLNGDESVRLTLMQMSSQTLLVDRNYGVQSGTFRSGDLYLPLAEGTTPYLITLYVGDTVYAIPFMQKSAQMQRQPESSGWEDGWVDATAVPGLPETGSWGESCQEPSMGWDESTGWQDPNTGWVEGAGW